MCTYIETIRMIFNQGQFKNRNFRVYPTPRLHKKILQLFVKFCFMGFFCMIYYLLPMRSINVSKYVFYILIIFFSFLKQK